MKEINLTYFKSKGKYIPFDEHKEILKSYKEEIERLTTESTKWESKFYDEAKKVDKAIEYITYKSILGEKGLELNLCDKQIEKLLDILKGSDKE